MDNRANISPRVSVIIVSFNRRELLAETLSGLRAQTYCDLETIVVDNGSTDGSADLVAEDFPAARLLRLQENLGFAGGNNRGIAVARGELIALLNNDAVPEPNWLSELVSALERHPHAGFCASRVLLASEPHLLDAAGDGITLAGTAFRRGHRQPATQFASEGLIFGASGSAALYRRAMLDAIGCFDEDFFAVYEDVDLSFRAQLAGYACVYVPTAMVCHRGSGTIGRFSESYVYQTQRNVEYFFFKNIPTALWVLLLPGHVLYNLLGLLFFTFFKRRVHAFLRAKWDVLRAMPRVLAKRRAVQSTRRVSVRYLLGMLEWGWLFRTAREKLS